MIVVGSDHAGYPLKEFIKKALLERGLEVLDVGTDSTDSCDYPVYGLKAADAILSGLAERGILVCGTGVGISIAANKKRGIRCVVCSESCSAELSRRHNDANMLALGARIVGEELALSIVDAFLRAPYDGGERHGRRVGMLNSL